MKYLKRFNESQSNYSSYEDVIDKLEEVIYNLEVSFDYDVEPSYEIKNIYPFPSPFNCVLTIKTIGWEFDTDPIKKELLEQEIDRIEKMFQPYLAKEDREKVFNIKIPKLKVGYDSFVISIKFNLFCQKCKNENKLTCPECAGNKTKTCDCDGGYSKCYHSHSQDWHLYLILCKYCSGTKILPCERCKKTGQANCEKCEGEGVINCKHEWE